MLSTALPLSNSCNDEAQNRIKSSSRKQVLDMWMQPWMTRGWLMPHDGARWSWMDLDGARWLFMRLEKCWCLIWEFWCLAWWRFRSSQLMNSLQGVRVQLPRPRQALHPVLAARPPCHPPWLRPVPQARPRPRPPVPNRRRVLPRVPKPRRWLLRPRHSRRPRRPRSRPDQLWPKQWGPKRKQVSTRMESVVVQTWRTFLIVRPHPEFGILVQDSVLVIVLGGFGVLAHSCSHLKIHLREPIVNASLRIRKGHVYFNTFQHPRL